MARLPQPGGDSGNWGTILNDYLSQAHNANGLLKDDAVTSNVLAPSSVTSASIAAGAVTEQLLAGAVQTKLNAAPEIADGSITKEKLETDVQTQLDTTETALAGRLSTTQLDTKYATNVQVKRTLAPNNGLYLPSNTAMIKWRTKRNAVIAGIGQAHIAVLGDSIPFGAAATGATPPKYRTSWPGRLRSLLAKEYGNSGSGVVIADANIRANPTWDDRWTYGPNIVDHTFGFHGVSCFRLDAIAGTYLDFTGTCDHFKVYNFSGSGGFNTASVDGGAGQTFRNLSTGSAPTLPIESGYHSKHLVTKVPAGTQGNHTLRITPSTANNIHDTFLVAIEAGVDTQGVFRVSIPSISGKSLSSMGALGTNNDETNGLMGLPLIDMLKSDLLVIALGINDWQSARDVTQIKAGLTTLIQRQRSNGINSGGGPHPNGDAILIWNAQPDITGLAKDPVLWEAYRQAYYEVADEQNVALIDVSVMWKDYATASSLSLFADVIHPNDKGAADIADIVNAAIMRT